MSSRALVIQHRARSARSRSPRVAVTAVFVAHGLLFASWTAHIPHIMRHLGLTDGTLGIALLGAPAGSVAAMLLASYLIPKLGSRRVVQLALVGYCGTGPLVGLTGSLAALLGALFIWGAFQGTLDVAMNTQAIAVERAPARTDVGPARKLEHRLICRSRDRRAGRGRRAGPDPRSSSSSARSPCSGLACSHHECSRMRSSVRALTSGRRPGRCSASRWSGGMILLGAIAFAGMLCEGASADWASVYLSGPLHATGAVPGLGYAAFALAMVTVRLSGNRLLRRFRPSRLLPVLAAAATAGFAAGLAIGRPAAAIAGFVFLGLGLASVIPAVFSAAGRIAGLHPGMAVATVSACGWTGFVCGPPLIGHLASLASLSLALGLLPFLTAFVAVGTLLSRALRDAPQGPACPARSDGTS